MTETTISHYKILDKLGEGGMGVVYKAEDTKLERTVALKFLPAHLLGSDDVLKRFEREAKSSAALSHPNVCTVHEIDQADDQTFIAMELIEGESLNKLIARGPLKLDEALDIAQQVAKGLEAAHKRGIVHRDIKPENIMVGEDGHVTIMDFGLAQLTEASRLTRKDETVGTVFYMSPEQTQGSGTDHRTDIWSLGVVLYEMVTGQKPFKGDYDKAVMYSILNEAPEPLTGLRTGVPVELELLINKCLAKEAANRYQNAEELIVDLRSLDDKLKSGKSTVMSVAAAPERESSAQAKWRTKMAIAAAVALAAAVLIGTQLGDSGGLAASPTYKRLTFRRGTITSAKFAPDGDTIVYSAAWDGGRRELYTTRAEGSESRSLGIQDVDILDISDGGEMALLQRPPLDLGGSFPAGNSAWKGTLLRSSLSGGAPRAVADAVEHAGWTTSGELGIVRRADGRAQIELPVGNKLYETAGRIAGFSISPSDGRIAFSTRPWGFAGVWEILVINSEGEATIVERQETGENLILAWSPDSRELWYEMGWLGGQTVRAATLAGDERIVENVPTLLRLLDVGRDGGALVSRVNWRTGIYCRAPGETEERELSWFDASEVNALTPDGGTILFTEFGEGGEIDRWGAFLRKTNGEPAIRLGDGQAFGLSPDGSMALTMLVAAQPELVLLPTGPGQPLRIRNESIRNYEAGAWMPDGRQIVFVGAERDQGVRIYAQDIEGGQPRPLTPEGYRFGLGQNPVSPDGLWIAANSDGGPSLFPTKGGERRAIPSAEPEDNILAWSADGRFVFLASRKRAVAEVYKVNLATGEKTFWRTLAPADAVGLIDVYAVQISADEQSYCYTYTRNISDLYLAEGLR